MQWLGSFSAGRLRVCLSSASRLGQLLLESPYLEQPNKHLLKLLLAVLDCSDSTPVGPRATQPGMGKWRRRGQRAHGVPTAAEVVVTQQARCSQTLIILG